MTEYFLDQGIIIGYSSFIFDEKEVIIKTIEKFGEECVKFLEDHKEEDFITCFYIVEKDLPQFKKRRKTVLEEVRKKLQNPGYEIGSSEEAIKNLYKQDISRANKIFSLLGVLSEKDLMNFLIKIEATFSIRIDFLFKSIINKIVVPVETIDKKLVNILREFIDNFSDCNVFASVLQYTTEEEKRKIMFVTLDKEHFNENNISFIKQDMRLKEYNFPGIKILI